MSQSKKIIWNSLINYGQSICLLVIGLLAVPLMLNYLGPVDFGLLSTIGGTGALTVILTAALALAARRHLAFEIGRKDFDRTRKVYTNTTLVFWCLAIIMFSLGMFFAGPLCGFLQIPEERFEATQLALRMTVLGWVISIASSPLNAVLAAHQDFLVVACYGLISKVCAIALILLLSNIQGDPLKMFATGLVIIESLIFLGKWLQIHHRYSSARLSLHQISWKESKRILSFAGWTTLGSLTVQLRTNFSIIVINLMFGPLMNAAFAIGNAFSKAMQKTSLAVHQSLGPVLTGAVAREEKKNIAKMISAGSRFPFFCAFLLFLPMVFEAELILTLWLGEYPLNSEIFVKLIGISMLGQYLSNGYGMAMSSADRLREIIPLAVSIQLGGFVISIIGLKFLDFPAWSMPVFTGISFLVCAIIYPVLFGNSLGFSVKQWWPGVMVPILKVSGIGVTTGLIIQPLFAPGLFRLMIVSLSVFIANLIAIWFWGMTNQEKRKFSGFLEEFKRKLDVSK